MNKNMDTYEKKYKNALTIAQSRFKIEKDESVLTCLGMMFPELRESEDERIRKAIVNLFEVASEAYLVEATGFKKEQFLSYLEKQKEQKLAEWSEEDEKQLDDIISIIRGAYEHGITISETRHRNAYSWLNNLRPSWKPSEEQMEVLLNAEGLVRANNYNENAKILASLYEQLKKL